MTAEQYLALSALVSSDLTGVPINGVENSISQLIATNRVENYKDANNNVNREFSALTSLSDWKLIAFQPNTASGFAGAAFQSPTGEIVFAFRGTEPKGDLLTVLQDYEQDLQIATDATLSGPSQFDDAHAFWLSTMQQVGAGNYSGYSFTGHSLGGGLAQYMTYMTNEVGHSVTFNAVGIGQGLDGVDPNDYNDSIKDYVNENDIIGQYGVQLGVTQYIADTGNGNFNSAVDNGQLALRMAIIEAMKRGDIAQAAGMAALNALSDMGQGTANTVNDILFGAHGLDSLLDSTGGMSNDVPGPNIALNALTQLVNGFATVTGWMVGGMHYIAVEILPEVGAATVKVTLAITDAGIQVVTEIGETVWNWAQFMGNTAADIIYTTAMAIGSTIEDAAEVAVALYQFLFSDYVVVNGTGADDTYLAPPLANKSSVIYGLAGSDTIYGSDQADIADGGEGNDMIYGQYGNDFVYGRNGNDHVQGSEGDDVVFGNAGNDILHGDKYNPNSYLNMYVGSGADVLDGGTGNDQLFGGDGNDTYIFNIGSGQDEIYDRSGATSHDVIRFGAGISPEDMYLHRRGDDLYLRIGNTTDNLRVKGFFYTGSGTVGAGVIEAFIFANGVVWDQTYVRERARNITESYSNTDGTTTMYGYDNQHDIAHGDGLGNIIYTFHNNDMLYGNSGDDTLYGGDGNDTLFGGIGNDKLYGDNFHIYSPQYSGTGNDVLDGGSGNDFLGGGYGDDTYMFGIGSGQDELYDISSSGSLDAVVFDTGIAPEDVYLHRRSDDLYLRVNNSADSITIKSFFYTGAGTGVGVIEQVRFANGTIWDEAILREKARHITESYVGNNGTSTMYGYGNQADIMHGDNLHTTMYAYEGSDALYGNMGNDTMQGGNGDDELFGGEGNDTLYGDSYQPSNWQPHHTGNGNDLLVGGTGNDTLYGGQGSDRYVFNNGDGQDHIHEINGTDELAMNYGVESIIFTRIYDNIAVSFAGTSDTITVNSWYLSQDNQIEQFTASDGSTMSGTQMDQLIQAMATFSANNNGISWNQALQTNQQDVQAILSQYWTAPTA